MLWRRVAAVWDREEWFDVERGVGERESRSVVVVGERDAWGMLGVGRDARMDGEERSSEI